MNGKELIKRLKRYGKAAGIRVYYDAEHGKGSHGRLYYGDKFTTMKNPRTEIGESLLKAMCRQLGVDRKKI